MITHLNTKTFVKIFENLTLNGIDELRELYALDCFFKDPFNEAQGLEATLAIFRHMFTQLHNPRFVVQHTIEQHPHIVLNWDFHFAFTNQPDAHKRCSGMSHLMLNANGQIQQHIDYWDPSDGIYQHFPVLGWVLKKLKTHIAVK